MAVFLEQLLAYYLGIFHSIIMYLDSLLKFNCLFCRLTMCILGMIYLFCCNFSFKMCSLCFWCDTVLYICIVRVLRYKMRLTGPIPLKRNVFHYLLNMGCTDHCSVQNCLQRAEKIIYNYVC